MSTAMQYGIKEVADVKFYKVEDNITVNDKGQVIVAANKTPVLSLDTLKVSNIEFTAEQTEARGGKGNAPLIVWDYGREINVTLEDALMSLQMFNLLFGEEDENTSVSITPNSYPGTYTVVGKTFARGTDGKDRLFTFFIPKAKIQSETTLTMEADGDPTVFNMTLRVLRNNEDPMMKLILDTAITDGVIPPQHWDSTATA
jgi:hypothetical protein